jgi:dimethylaniline monooxygenase (N-oxide forming)
MRVAIIGGGPSGLVQLKVLLDAKKRFGVDALKVKLFEAHDKIGGIFYHHSYEEGELVSSKFLTSFSDHRPRPDDPDFFTSDRYLEYLKDYADKFGLWPHMHFGTRVLSVRRGGHASEHIVKFKTATGETVEWDCDAIAVCSGVHSIPHIPELPGIENVPVSMHSEKFKSREQFGKDKTVVILGSGETSADIAYLAITGQTKRVILCHRDGWLGAPKRNPEQRFLPWLFGSEHVGGLPPPVDTSQVTLFDSMYVHPMVRDSMLVWNHYNALSLTIGGFLCGGSSYGIDQWVGQCYSDRLHVSRIFFNKAWQRISNYCSYPYRPTKWPLALRIRRFFWNTEVPPPPRVIDVAPTPTHVSSDGVMHFPNNGRVEAERIQHSVVKPDVVIFATGYLPSFPFLNGSDNKGHKRYPVAFDANVRHIWKADDPTVGFIGFVRPGFGAIPPLSEMQSMLFAMNLLNRVPNALDPEDEWHFRLLHPPDARVSYGVEHDSYAYQLAKDMDGAPSFTEVIKTACVTRNGWRLPWVWAAGSSFNAKFRMRGPWKDDGAAEILTGEMWETITRRKGLFGNFPIGVLPMIYLGSINLYFFLYATFWDSLAAVGLARPLQRRNEPKRIMEMARMQEAKKRATKG